NLNYWNQLDPKVQDFLQQNIDVMIDNIWQSAAEETLEGYRCNTGSEDCSHEIKGRMKLVEPTPSDHELLKKITAETVVPKWAARCSTQCVADFNDTIGKLLGLAPTK